MEQQATSVLQRIAKATIDIGRLQKDKENKHAGYWYLSEESVKQAVQKTIGEHSIAPKRISFEVISDEYTKTAKGGDVNLVKLRCTLEWEDGSACEGLGSGQDYGDKALMKAQTCALREAWKNRLTIPTGADPEGDPAGDERAAPEKTAPPKQAKNGARPAGQQDARPTQRSQANGSPARTISFGRHKDRQIDDPRVEVRDLEYLIESANRSLSDPGKSRFHALDRARLRELKAEIERRRNSDPQSEEPADDPSNVRADFGEDDIPF